MDVISDYLIAFWFVILVAGGGFKFGEWIWRRIISPYGGEDDERN